MSAAWPHGKVGGRPAAMSGFDIGGFDSRILAALQQEQRAGVSGSPSRSWSASPPRQEGGAQPWTCRDCGYKRNPHSHAHCTICNRAWSWKKQALQDKRAGLALANRFQQLAGEELAGPTQPPWKYKSKGRGTTSQWYEGQRRSSWRKGRRCAPSWRLKTN